MADPDFFNGAAQAIGQQLADSAASAAGSFVVGQILSAIGLDTDPQAAIQSELSAILAGINQLEQDVAALKQDMDAAMSQLQYSEVESGILPWIDKNAALNGLFQDLATATDATGLANCKAAILDVLDGSITSAPSAWNNALGGDGTAVNLIEAWNRVVRLHYDFFGQDASLALAKHWSYIDAQQAQSIMYCVEWLNHQGDRAGALRTLKQWRTDRTTQIGLLRGMPYPTERFVYTESDPSSTGSETVWTPVNWFPSGIVITTTSGAPMVYCLTPVGPISRGQGPGFDDFDQQYNQLTLRITGVGQIQDVSTDIPTSWNVPYQGTLVEFLNHCGGSVGGGGADYFATALANQGFNLPSGQLRLWTDVNRDSNGTPIPSLGPNTLPSMPGPYRSIFVDGDSWWSPSTDPDDSAYLLFQRRLQPNEADNYWYS